MNEQLKILRIFYGENKRLPSYREMLGLFGYKSKNSVYRVVKKLIAKGLLKKDKAGKLIANNALFGIKILGSIQAGFPSPAEEELADAISLDDYLISNKQASFLLKVSGHSMINAGINPGDLVVVERGRQAKNNDIVVACVDNQWTIKRLLKKGGQFILKAENPRYKPIKAQQELCIEGVVTGVIRKYQ